MALMTPNEMIVFGCEDSDIFVGCRFSAITSTWPTVFTYNDCAYMFEYQEPIPSELVGHVAGFARYTLEGTK